MSVKFRCMLAEQFDEKFAQFPCAVEPKLDGVRALALPSAGDPKLYLELVTRTGKPIKSVSQTLMRELETLATEYEEPVVFDGELVSGLGADFNVTVGDVRRHKINDDLRYHVFDAVPLSAFPDRWVHAGKAITPASNLTYKERRKQLTNACFMTGPSPLVDAPVRPTAMHIAESLEDVQNLYVKFRQAGYEGVMVKALDGLYHPRRNRAWMKMKEHQTDDLMIVAAEEGTGRLVGTLGALVCENPLVRDGQIKVGTGFSDRQRAELWAQIPDLLGTYVEIGYQQVTNAGSRRHPTFIRLRPDKTP